MTKTEQPKVCRCFRCGALKDVDQFRPGQKVWATRCKNCEATPAGTIPKFTS